MAKVNKHAQILGRLGGRPRNENRQAYESPKLNLERPIPNKPSLEFLKPQNRQASVISKKNIEPNFNPDLKTAKHYYNYVDLEYNESGYVSTNVHHPTYFIVISF
jgi:hypothetical protein